MLPEKTYKGKSSHLNFIHTEWTKDEKAAVRESKYSCTSIYEWLHMQPVRVATRAVTKMFPQFATTVSTSNHSHQALPEEEKHPKAPGDSEQSGSG